MLCLKEKYVIHRGKERLAERKNLLKGKNVCYNLLGEIQIAI